MKLKPDIYIPVDTNKLYSPDGQHQDTPLLQFLRLLQSVDDSDTYCGCAVLCLWAIAVYSRFYPHVVE